MSKPKAAKYIEIAPDMRIAYRKQTPLASRDDAIGVVFLGGYASDMLGTKAEALAEFCHKNHWPFLRFDYRGHGESDGDFLNFGIGDWMQDARFMIENLMPGKVLLIGSSMGGWIAAKLARDWPKKIAGFIGIAAAPDFTEDNFWASFTDDERKAIERGDYVERASGYEEPYRISPKLIEQGRENLVLRSDLTFEMPVRLFQGLEDEAVSNMTALRLAEHANCSDLILTFVNNSNHSFSNESNLKMIFDCVSRFMKPEIST